MAVKGSILKKNITDKILEVFGDNAFLYNDGKEIRICGTENGEALQVKCVLTCAKVNVTNGADTALPGDFPAPVNAPVTPESTAPVAPSEDEKARVAQMLKSLGL